MAATNDTIKGLLAEFRGYSAGMPDSYHVTMSWADFRRMLDRFEAANKREIEATAAKCCQLGRLAGYGASEIKHPQEPVGDAAKLREALKATLDLLWDIHNANRSPQSNQAYAVIRQIKAALAAPPRNCDVGIPEEQDERFHRFCVMQRTGSCAGCPDPVGGRTVANGIRECALVWAQMPYEEGGAK